MSNDIKPGQYVRVGQYWGYVVSLLEDNQLLLSGWGGKMTSVKLISQVKEVRDTCPPSLKYE